MLKSSLLWLVGCLLLVSVGCSGASSSRDDKEPVGISQSALTGVTWIASAGISVNGSNITKTGAAGWNAAAHSSQSLSGDGSTTFTTGEATTYKMAGLTTQVVDNGFATINYALFLTDVGTVQVYENGTSVASVGSYVAGDVFSLNVASGVVTYLKNGTLLYTSTASVTFPLVLDASLYSTGATINSATLDSSGFWQNPVGVTVSGQSLTKTGSDGWNAGASTVASLAGDGSAMFTTAEATTYKMAGLTHAVTDHGYATIDFALFLTSQGTVDVYEAGTPVISVGSYVASDVFTVQVAGGVVSYQKNGTLLYTSTKTPSFPLYFDASLYSNGATVNSVSLSTAAFWQNVVGVSVSGNGITKTGAQGWNAGASTVASLAGDGSASFTAGEIDYKMAGLTHTVADSGYATIDYAFFLTPAGNLSIYEDGTQIIAVGGYAPSDVLTVQVSGGVVSYQKNGTLLYTSAKAPTFPLVFDASLYYTNASITNVTVSTSAFWQNVNGVSVAGHGITKTGADGWNAGASTIASLSGDGTASFTTAEATTYKMAGLTHTVSGSGYATIDFAMFFTTQGVISIYEDGALVASGATSYAAGDVLAVKSTGGVVTYLKNGTVFYTSTKTPTFPLYVDASLYSNGATIQNVTLGP